MLLHLPQVLTFDELQHMQTTLADAPWGDGKVTAGTQSVQVKNNEQLPQQHPITQALQEVVLQALKRNKLFFTATLPKAVFPPLFNRYGGESNSFGNHVDNAIRFIHGSGERVRTDVSATLFLAEPQDYDGGELVIEDTFGSQRVKLAAGDMVIYPSSSVHRVEPVTRGARVAFRVDPAKTRVLPSSPLRGGCDVTKSLQYWMWRRYGYAWRGREPAFVQDRKSVV